MHWRAGLAARAAAPQALDPESIGHLALDPGDIADAVIAAIHQPSGVTLSAITVRAAGDGYIL